MPVLLRCPELRNGRPGRFLPGRPARASRVSGRPRRRRPKLRPGSRTRPGQAACLTIRPDRQLWVAVLPPAGEGSGRSRRHRGRDRDRRRRRPKPRRPARPRRWRPPGRSVPPPEACRGVLGLPGFAGQPPAHPGRHPKGPPPERRPACDSRAAFWPRPRRCPDWPHRESVHDVGLSGRSDRQSCPARYPSDLNCGPAFRYDRVHARLPLGRHLPAQTRKNSQNYKKCDVRPYALQRRSASASPPICQSQTAQLPKQLPAGATPGMSPTGSSTFDGPVPGWLRQPQSPSAMPTPRIPRRPAVCFDFTGLPVPDCQAGIRGASAAGPRFARRAAIAAAPATKPVQQPQPSARPDESAARSLRNKGSWAAPSALPGAENELSRRRSRGSRCGIRATAKGNCKKLGKSV